MAEKPETTLPHLLQLQDRSKLTVSGVSDVDSFDETVTVLYTSMGELTVKGEGLHIRQFDVESGDLIVDGKIHELLYAAVRARSDSFFRKLFR